MKAVYYMFNFCVAGANGEVQHCPAHPNDAPVGGTGAAMATEQEGGGQQNKEPVAKKATRTTAEKGTDRFDIDTMTLIYLSKMYCFI